MKKGKAYGFFNCRASKDEINAELPTIRDFSQTPSRLELKLKDDLKEINGDSDIKAIAQVAKDIGINYVLEATYPGNTNRTTADELSGILNQAYQSLLYEDGENFKGQIYYKEDGSYISRE